MTSCPYDTDGDGNCGRRLCPHCNHREPKLTLIEPQDAVYLAGGMANLPGHGFDVFTDAAAQLRKEGLVVVSPHENCTDPKVLERAIALGKGFKETQEYRDFLRLDLCHMLACKLVFLLPGWLSSNGATMEAYVADRLGIPLWSYAPLRAERKPVQLILPPGDPPCIIEGCVRG